MSEHTIESLIGKDLDVEVTFDYMPEQAETRTDPSWPAEVENITVDHIADGMFRKDITSDLSEKCLERIKIECFESIESDDRGNEP